MKRLTLNKVAKANLRVNKKAYLSLFLGILLAVFLAAASSLCAWGTVRGHEEQMAKRVGWLDMCILGNDGGSDEQLRRTGYFREIGHVTVNAAVKDRDICTGWYDETAGRLMNRTLTEGRMPETAGEIAAERSALIRLGYENAQAGDTLTLTMQPVYGTETERTFLLTGILNEQTDNLDASTEGEGMRLPAMLVSQDDSYEIGGAVVHRVLTYAPLATFNQITRHVPPDILGNAFGVSRETGGIVYYDSGWDRASILVNRILVWAVLGAAMMLSACVGITSAMESLLSRKTEDIGMLRAIGATRRQIRRIYGAEAWLLTATALPAGLLLGIAAAWLISRVMPDQVAFSLNAWLLIPIAALSILCVFIASRLPLYRASRQMPMGVLRDTGLLRRAARLKNHQEFRTERLIAGRRTLLHPLRQAGAAGMTALTLACTLMLGELALGIDNAGRDSLPAYELYGSGTAMTDESFTQPIGEDELTRADLRRIAAVPGVSRVRSVTPVTMNLLMEEVPEYFRTRHAYQAYPDGSKALITISALESWNGNDWLFYTDEEAADARARRDEDWEAYANVEALERMNLIRARLGLSETVVPVSVYVADIDPAELQEFVVDGSIAPEKLDSGEQALVFAPTVCAAEHEEGGWTINKWLNPDEVHDEDWGVVIRNDAFSAGMPLKLLELAAGREAAEYAYIDRQAYYENTEAETAATTVGAVLSGPVHVNDYYLSNFTVILSARGAEALGFKVPGPERTDVWVEGNPTAEEEEAITGRISQIAMSSRTQVTNRLELNREYMAKKLRQLLLFGALILLFFAVSVFMQVSGAARQIRSETRTIGTLRAVGADLKTLVGCYRLPVWACSAAALIPCLVFYAVSGIPALRLFRYNHPQILIPALIVMAGCVALACTAGIRGRLAGVTRQSIVENIREL